MVRQNKPRKFQVLPPIDAPITLEYELLSLPSAQHKAGLAGLVLMINAMRELKREPCPQMEIHALTVRITFCRAKYQSLMNELYGAGWVESREYKARRKKLPDGSKEEIPPLRPPYEETVIDKKTQKAKRVLVYEYKDVVPGGPFFAARVFGNFADKKRFLELWSDAIWNTVRGIPTTRTPYNERADGLPAGGSGVSDLWAQLVKGESSRTKGLPQTPKPVASSIWLGAQDHNAEYVAFQGNPKEILLLHFWNVVMQVFKPQVVERDTKTGEAKVTTGDGYILAIPEVSDLAAFQEDFSEALATLPDDPIPFRPPDSLICVPQEGALQFLGRLSARAKSRATRRVRYSVSAIEVFHLDKPGNTVMTLSSDRLVVDDEKLTDFERIHRKTHPLLRAQLIRALLRGEPWYRGFNRIAATTDAAWLVGQSGSVSTAWFCKGSRGLFEVERDSISVGEMA